MMIFPIIIFLIAINSSTNGQITRTVTATIRCGDCEKEWVKCRGTDVYNEVYGMGKLLIETSNQENTLPPATLKKILLAIGDEALAKSYSINQPIITMVTEEKGTDSDISLTQNIFELKILPNVQQTFQDLQGSWNVEIPYCRHDVEVSFTENKMELTLLDMWNQIFDCDVTILTVHGTQEVTWILLQIKKDVAPPDFMTLENSPIAIFLEDVDDPEQQPPQQEEPEEHSTEHQQKPKKAVYRATFGNMHDRSDAYCAQVILDIENTVVVKVTTRNTPNPVRFVCGFANDQETEIMFFRGSRVLIVSAENPATLDDVQENFSWAFSNADKIELNTQTSDGVSMDDFTDINFAELKEITLQYGDDHRTLTVLPVHFTNAVQTAAIVPSNTQETTKQLAFPPSWSPAVVRVRLGNTYPYSAADGAEKRKYQKYRNLNLTYPFLPVAHQKTGISGLEGLCDDEGDCSQHPRGNGRTSSNSFLFITSKVLLTAAEMPLRFWVAFR